MLFDHDQTMDNVSVLNILIAEALEQEVQEMLSTAVSFVEIQEDVKESANLLCNTPNPDKRLLDLHVSYLWDLVDRREIMAESARYTFSLIRDANIEPNWNEQAFQTVLEHPQFKPLLEILKEETSGEKVIRLQSEEDVLDYLGISKLEDIPDLLEERAKQFAESLRDNLRNVNYSEPCIDPGQITLTSYGGDVAVGIGAAIFFGLLVLDAFDVIDIFGWFPGKGDWKGKRERRYIEEASEDAIASFPTQLIKGALFEMMNDGTENRQERAILKVLRALGCERAVDELFFDSDVPHKKRKSVPKKHGNWITWIYNTMSGKEKSELIAFLSRCGLDFSSPSMSRNDIRNFIEDANCGTLSSMTNSQIENILRRTLDGNVGNRRERAIIKLFRCLQPYERVKMILSKKGLSPQDFEDKVQGKEWKTLDSIFSP